MGYFTGKLVGWILIFRHFLLYFEQRSSNLDQTAELLSILRTNGADEEYFEDLIPSLLFWFNETHYFTCFLCPFSNYVLAF